MKTISIKAEHYPTTSQEAEKFIAAACRFESSVLFQYNNKTINAKSVLGLLSLGKLDGELIIACNGADEENAARVIAKLLS